MKFKLPSWLRREKISLPPWAKVNRVPENGRVSIVIDVNTVQAMTEWLDIFDVRFENATQYWIECAYQCAKLDVQASLVGTIYDPRTAGKPAEIHFDRAPEFALVNFPPGEAKNVTVNGRKMKLAGVMLATQGREARNHYIRIRGSLPM